MDTVQTNVGGSCGCLQGCRARAGLVITGCMLEDSGHDHLPGATLHTHPENDEVQASIFQGVAGAPLGANASNP